MFSSVALFKTEPSEIPSEPSALKRSSVGSAEFPSIIMPEIVGLSSTSTFNMFPSDVRLTLSN